MTVFLCFCISHFSDETYSLLKFSTDNRQAEDMAGGKDHRVMLFHADRARDFTEKGCSYFLYPFIQLGCFCVLCIVNNAAINMLVQIPFPVGVFMSFG